MAARADEDYVNFTEASTELVKAQDHFNRAKELFLDFKRKYPQWAELHLPPPDQFFRLQPLNEAMQAYSALGVRSLLQRRMMPRQLPRTPNPVRRSPPGGGSHFSPGPGAGAGTGSQGPQAPVYAGIPGANYLSFDERPIFSCGGPPIAYESRLQSRRGMARPGPSSRFQRVPPSWLQQPGPSTPPLQRRLFANPYGLGTPPPVQRRLFFDSPEVPNFGGNTSPLPNYEAAAGGSAGQEYGYEQRIAPCARPVSPPARFPSPASPDPCAEQRGIMEESMPSFYDSSALSSILEGESSPEFYESSQSG